MPNAVDSALLKSSTTVKFHLLHLIYTNVNIDQKEGHDNDNSVSAKPKLCPTGCYFVVKRKQTKIE